MANLTGSIKKFRSSVKKQLKPLQKMGQGARNLYLLILTGVLIIVVLVLLNLVTTHTFKPYFNCAFLVDRSLKSDTLCKGLSIDFGSLIGTWHILPAVNVIDSPLEGLRKFIAWNVILFIALLSIVLSYIILKIGSFVKYVLTPEGRKAVLTSLSVWLFIFAVLCLLFYVNVGH
jgi:hypothetical protein